MTTVVSAPESSHAVADRLLRSWAAYSELFTQPKHSEALVIPVLIQDELGLPESLIDRIAQIWDTQVRKAIEETVAQVRDLQQ